MATDQLADVVERAYERDELPDWDSGLHEVLQAAFGLLGSLRAGQRASRAP